MRQKICKCLSGVLFFALIAFPHAGYAELIRATLSYTLAPPTGWNIHSPGPVYPSPEAACADYTKDGVWTARQLYPNDWADWVCVWVSPAYLAGVSTDIPVVPVCPTNYSPQIGPQYSAANGCMSPWQYSCPVIGGWQAIGWSNDPTINGIACARPDCTSTQVRDQLTGKCLSPQEPKCVGQICPGAGNPINVGSGRKVQSESIYEDAAGAFGYRLLYSSRRSTDLYLGGIAQGSFWVSPYQAGLTLGYDGTATLGPSSVTAIQANGRQLNFYRSASSNNYLPDADIADRLVRLTNATGGTTGWLLLNSEDALECYDVNGRLLAVTDRRGRTRSSTYDANGRTAAVMDTFGRSLQFAYDAANRISAATLPDGGVVGFTYDGNNNLTGITWPDATSRGYLYEDSRFLNNLTGLIDENGSRYASWAYDANGRGISSTHAGGADQTTVAYNTSSSTVTDARGTSRIVNLATVLNVTKSAGESQPGGSGCGAASSAQSYDANGNVASQSDFNGNVTTYSYDLTRNLETKRVEASGKPEARTVSTQWHAYWRQPVQVAAPLKLTTYVYNGDGGVYCAPATATVPSISGGTQPIGVLCQKTEQATTDANGSQGFGATPTGTPRTWRWTYDQYGHLLTADGPRTDVADLTTYTYYDAADPDLDKRGNLATITDALGHQTQITAYDRNGHPLTIIDPNGVVTTLTYDARQRLTSRTVGSETTTYQYDAVGQLLKVTLPDGSFLAYTYDAAHRLTAVADALGNQVLYKLDALGNRVEDDVKDPTGALAQTRQRVYDALNRLQTLIGGGAD